MPARARRKASIFLVAANERNPSRKAECLEVMAASCLTLPATPPMALHRRDTERIEEWSQQEPRLLARQFDEAEIFPAEFGTRYPAASAYVTPLIGGVSLLHMVVEFCDSRWRPGC